MVDALIRLFESTATEFGNNGIGVLVDAASCIVIEERNGSFELEMTYPITGRYYGEISLRRIIVAKPNPYSNPQPFRIFGITKPINGIVTINAQHISYDLIGYPVKPFGASDVELALLNLKNASIISHPFTFWTDKRTTAEFNLPNPISSRTILGGVEGSILDVYGGEYEFDNYIVRLWGSRGSNRGVSIRYGKNLTDLEQEENCSNVYTGVYPYWYSEDQGLVELSGKKYIEAEGTYNFVRILPLDLSDKLVNLPTESELRSEAESYMKENNIGVPKVSITVSFVQLAQSDEYKNYTLLEQVHLCDTVNVEFPELNVTATSKCISTTYDVITNKYKKIELGESKSSLSSTIVDTNNTIDTQVAEEHTNMQRAVDRATKRITGQLGGYVIIHDSTGGDQPDEILIMDTPDIETAMKVWRWNNGGLGYSRTGYNGPYELAMTQDGEFVANFITVGELDAGLVHIKNLYTDMNSNSEVVHLNEDGLRIYRDNIADNPHLLMWLNSGGLYFYKGDGTNNNINNPSGYVRPFIKSDYAVDPFHHPDDKDPSMTYNGICLLGPPVVGGIINVLAASIATDDRRLYPLLWVKTNPFSKGEYNANTFSSWLHVHGSLEVVNIGSFANGIQVYNMAAFWGPAAVDGHFSCNTTSAFYGDLTYKGKTFENWLEEMEEELQGQIEDIQKVDLTKVDKRISSLEKDLSELENKVSTYKSIIDAHTNLISNLTSRVSALESKI